MTKFRRRRGSPRWASLVQSDTSRRSSRRGLAVDQRHERRPDAAALGGGTDGDLLDEEVAGRRSK